MAPESRVVEGDLGIEQLQRLDRPVGARFAHDRQRIDLDQVGVLVQRHLDQAGADGGGLLEVVAEPQAEGHLACLERLETQLRVGVDLDDGVGVLLGQRLDLDAALGRTHEHDALGGAVEDRSEVELAHDVGARRHQHATDGDALDVHAQDGFGVGFGFFGRARELDAAGLAAAADEHLGLDDHGRRAATEVGGRLLAGLGGGGGDGVGGNGQPGSRQEGLGVEFLQFHGRRRA